MRSMSTAPVGPQEPDDPEESGEFTDPLDAVTIDEHKRNALEFAMEYDCNDHPWPNAVFAVVRELERLQAASAAHVAEIARLRDHYWDTAAKMSDGNAYRSISDGLAKALNVLAEP